MPRPKRFWSSSNKPRRWGDVNGNSNTESSLTNSNHGNIGITGSSSDGHSNLSSIPGQSQINPNLDNEYGISFRPPLPLGLSMSKQQHKSNKSSSATSSGSSNKNNSSSGNMSSNKKMEFGFDPWATDSPAKDENNNNNRWDHHTGSSSGHGNGIEDDTPSPTSVADVPGVVSGVSKSYTGTSKIRDYTVSHEDDFFSSRLSKNSAYLNSHLEKNKQRSRDRDRDKDRYLDRDRDEGVNRDSNGNDTATRWGTTNANASSGAYNFGMYNVSNSNNKGNGDGIGNGEYEYSSYHRPNDMNYLPSQHTASTYDNHNLPSLASSSQSQSSTGTNSLGHSHTGSSGTNSHSETVLGSGSASMPNSRMEPIYHAPADQQQQQQQHFPPKPQQRPQHLHPPPPPPPPHNGFRNRNSSINHLLNKKNSSNSNAKPHIIPGVSKMTMRQMLSVIFSAYWDRADLYTDVLELEHDNDVDVTTNFNPRQLKLAFFRAGRVALATPIESADDMTMLSAGFRAPSSVAGNGNNGNGNNKFSSGGSVAGSTVSVVQAGTPVSRKAKLRFQAISLAYELLQDGDKRRMYNEWRMWNSRLPPPRSRNVPVTDRFSPVNPDETISARFRQREEEKRLASAAAQQDKDGLASVGVGIGMGGFSASRVCETPSILRKSIRCPKGAASNRMRRSLANISGRRTKAQIQQHQHEQLHLQSIKDRQESVRLSERKITWNEEVEELTIMEDDIPETASSAYSPPRGETLGYNALDEEGKGGVGSSGSKENTNPTLFEGMRNFFDDAQKDDPYGPTAEDWPGTVDMDGHGPLPTYQRDLSKRKSNKFATSSSSFSGRETGAGSGPLPGLGPIRFEQASTVESYIERNNFQSLGSRTEQLSSGDAIYDETNPNDSLMIILDGPYDSSETEGHGHGPGHIATQKPDCSWTADDKEETDDELCWDGFVDPVPDGGGDTDVTDDEIIAITSRARHQQQLSASASGTAPTVHDVDASGVIPHLPPNPVPEIIVDDMGSVSTNDFSASWASDQYEGGTGDCDLGHTVDLARGFQASLSNYINAAVMDMKEGLQIVGETLEENVAGASGHKNGSNGSNGNGNGNGSESKNFFLLDTTELDAMMSILKKEMDGLTESSPVFGSSRERDKGDVNGYNYGHGNGNDNATSTSDDIPQGIGYPPQSGFNMKQNKSMYGAGNGNASVSNISMGSSAPLTGGRKTQRFGTKRFFGNLFSRG